MDSVSRGVPKTPDAGRFSAFNFDLPFLDNSGQLAALAIWVSSAQAAINIDEAIIENGQVFVAGDKAEKREAVYWEGESLGINTNNGGAFHFNTTVLPADCVGRLMIGTEARDVVIENCIAGVPKTGQTSSHVAGDDGALQKGVEWPNPRFTVANGTVTDHLTGLIWLKNANCMAVQNAGPINDGDDIPDDGRVFWQTALDFANALASGNCGLTDGSGAGDWRLPNIRELQSLVDYGVNRGPVLPAGHPFTSFESSNYWSSTTFASNTVGAWLVFFGNGSVNGDNKGSVSSVIAVRGGS